MEGHHHDSNDDNDHNNNNIWDVVDSWLNLDQQEEEVSHDNDHHHDDNAKSMRDQGMENEREVEDHQCRDEEDQLPLQIVWPSDPVPDSCSSCQVLREIVHTKGTHTTKLEIHGKVGLISHGIYSSNGGLAASDIQNQHMLDFSRQNLNDIREYLKDYLEEHRENGCSLMQETLSLFYEVLSTGYDWRNFDQGNNNAGPLVEQGETSDQATNPRTLQQVPIEFKSELAIQRERVKKMKLEDFAKYFDKRINDASEELRLCATVIKKKLRSFNISRWPYRKVESMKRKISELRAYSTHVRCRRTEAEIQRLQKRLSDILSGKVKP